MSEIVDLAIVGGGINGVGIARDAAGRGASVVLVEKDDLAAHTSGASSKLIHGGLRYLEQYEFRLVREALREREVLLRIAPHIIRPMTFVLPHEPHLRPAWMLRAGLALYDRIGGRISLPRSRAIDLCTDPLAAALKPEFTRGFAYTDAWVDDARLVVLNARSAHAKGARILTRTRCIAARRTGGHWTLELESAGGVRTTLGARVLVNAAGPWTQSFVETALALPVRGQLKLVKGSHIAVPRRYEGDHAYILQHPDRRVIFMVPYGEHLTAIGTTDIEVDASDVAPSISLQEIEYLCAAVSRYARQPVVPRDIVNTWSGVRGLYDDGSDNPAEVTRDYHLLIDAEGPPLLSVYGGKLTTYRKMAERALERLQSYLPGSAWTHREVLPGGDKAFDQVVKALRTAHPRLDSAWLAGLARRHGTLAAAILGEAGERGAELTPGLFECEVQHVVAHEWAQTAADILWRRTKFGLTATPTDVARLTAWLGARA